MVKALIGGLALLVLVGCGSKQPEPAAVKKSGRKQIYTTGYPLTYVAQRLVGDKADVVFPAPKDEDPVFWKPTEAMVRRYQQADLILLNGAEAEKWIATASLPLSKTVNASMTFTNEYLMFAEVTTHSHGPGGMHSHGSVDYNVWLDPVLLSRETEAVEAALSRLLPEAAADIQKRAEPLRNDLTKLDEQLRGLGKLIGTQPLLASHPVYAYLARRCGWDLHAVHWEPDEKVSADEWQKFDALRAQHPGMIMLWEAEPLPEVRAELEKRGIRLVVFETCGNTPAAGDYLSAMKANVTRLSQAVTALQKSDNRK